MSRRPAWWLDFLKTVWPLTRISAQATRWPVIGKLLTPVVIPIFSGQNFNISYLPVNAEVPGAQSMVLPTRILEEIVRRSAHRVILKRCTCRESEHCRTYPVQDACLLLGEGTKAIDPRIARHVSVEEALAHLKRMLDLGLISMVGRVLMDNYFYGVPNTGKMLTICFCCPCCCTVLNSAKYFPGTVQDSFVRVKGLEVAIDHGQCKRCGACTEVCFFRAVTLTPQGIVRDRSLCKGCGRCVSGCPSQAITMGLDDLEAAMDDVLGRIRQRIDFETSA